MMRNLCCCSCPSFFFSSSYYQSIRIILILSLLYVGYVVLLHLGLDSSNINNENKWPIIGFACNLFVALTLLGLSGSLIKRQQQRQQYVIYNSAILSQVFMFLKFMFSSFVYWLLHLYYNSTTNSNSTNSNSEESSTQRRPKLASIIWILHMISIVCQTISACYSTGLALESSKSLTVMQLHIKCMFNCISPIIMSYILQSLLILCCVIICIGCLWCSIITLLNDSSTTVDEIMDDFITTFQFGTTSTTTTESTCSRIISISQLIFFVLYSLLWIPTGLLLKNTTYYIYPESNPGSGSGSGGSQQQLIPTYVAATIIIILQWSFGTMYIIYIWIISLLVLEESDFLDVFTEQVYGIEIYNYSMMISFICLYYVGKTIYKIDSDSNSGGNGGNLKIAPSDFDILSDCAVRAPPKPPTTTTTQTTTVLPLSNAIIQAEQNIKSKKEKRQRRERKQQQQEEEEQQLFNNIIIQNQNSKSTKKTVRYDIEIIEIDD